jgi:hypothetical protein
VNHRGRKNLSNFLEVQLAGGLGNQLFQYSALIRIAKENNRLPRLIEQGPFDHKSMHGTSITSQNIQIATRRRLFEKSKTLSILWRIDRKIIARSRWYSYLRRIYQFQDSGCLSLPSDLSHYGQLRGYFQDWKHVHTSLPEIKTLFGTSKNNKILLEMMLAAGQSNILSIHARRGDYERISESQGVLSLQFYLEAARKIIGMVSVNEIWVFSDDHLFATDLTRCLEGLCDRILVVNQDILSAEEVINLMSRCEAHVISNSTFSWWGAALSSNPKNVIAPFPWSKDGRFSQGIYNESWELESSIWD